MGRVSELDRLSGDVFHHALGRLAYCRMADKAQASLYEFGGRLILGLLRPCHGIPALVVMPPHAGAQARFPGGDESRKDRSLRMD